LNRSSRSRLVDDPAAAILPIRRISRSAILSAG
jgi:hypothetical protein